VKHEDKNKDNGHPEREVYLNNSDMNELTNIDGITYNLYFKESHVIKENKSKEKRRQDENLRAEYVALSNYLNSLIMFHLTLLGFYLAANGFIVARTSWFISLPTSLLGILFTVSLYIFELCIHILFHHLAKWAIEIEQINWNFKSRKNALSFFIRQFPQYLESYEMIKGDHFATLIQILGKIKTIRSKFVSHSFALNILYRKYLSFLSFQQCFKLLRS